MSETLIASLISSAITLLVCVINNHFQNNKTSALIDYKITELTRRVDKHNNVIERTYKLEELTALQEEKLKVVNHRITDLEKAGE